jgi:hypothetical protein
VSDVISAFMNLPRAARWGLCAAVGVGAYFLLLEPIVDRVRMLSSASDSKAATLASHAKSSKALEDDAQKVALGVRRFGDVMEPGDPEQRALEFNRAVDEILKKNGVREHTSTTRTTPMGPGPLVARAGAEFRIDRLIKDIQFNSEPEVAAAVIADLERTPVVATVSRLQIREADSRDKSARQVRVSLAAEAWMLARKGKAR